jgi:hypothetical protein
MVDGFTDLSGSTSKRREVYMELLSLILSFVIAVVIIAFVGKWLWNYAVVELLSFARPARSVWHVIGLMFFWALIR